MLGPVFYQEMMLGGRRNQLHVFRWIYAGWLVLQVLWFAFEYLMTTVVSDEHTHATAVTISLAMEDGLITLEVTDNGRGLGTPARSSGLASMRRRAENNGGTLHITAPVGGGTRLTWTARPFSEEQVPAADGQA